MEKTAKTVMLRQLVLGQGYPKICLPLVGGTVAAVQAELAQAIAAQADLIEWRADYLLEALPALPLKQQITQLTQVATGLRSQMGNTPLLFTLRSTAEGGCFAGTDEQAAQLLCAMVNCGTVDAVDVELRLPQALLAKVVQAGRAAGCRVIVSHHRFDATPPASQMLQTLSACCDAGGDIAKLAVMPQTSQDVVALLSAAASFQAEGAVPFIAISMGELGAVSRIAGGVFGSCVTFGTAAAASAPGQIEAKTLRTILQALPPAVL